MITFARRLILYALVLPFALIVRVSDLLGRSYHAYVFRGRRHRQAKRYGQALADFDKAISVSRTGLIDSALAGRGETYREMGLDEKALQDLNKAIQLNPKNQNALACRGEIYRFKGRFDEALADLNLAIAIHEYDEWMWGIRGITHRQLGRYEDAIADFDQAIVLNNSDSAAFGDRAETYRLMGNYQQAVRDFDRALSLDACDAESLTGRADVHRNLGHADLALADLMRAVKVDSSVSSSLAWCALMLRQLKQNAEANRVIASALAQTPTDDEGRFGRAAMLALSGDSVQAIDLLHSLVAADEHWRYELRENPVFELLSNMPEYQKLLVFSDRDASSAASHESG